MCIRDRALDRVKSISALSTPTAVKGLSKSLCYEEFFGDCVCGFLTVSRLLKLCCTFVVSIKPLLAVSCYCFECLIVSLGNNCANCSSSFLSFFVCSSGGFLAFISTSLRALNPKSWSSVEANAQYSDTQLMPSTAGVTGNAYRSS